MPTGFHAPKHNHYDVIVIGGAMMGASAAWFLTNTPAFDGRVLVIERDPSYQFASTTHTNSCIRQQFSIGLNVQISQFGAQFIQNLRHHMGDDPRVPDLRIRTFGYLYLADSPGFADVLRANQTVQNALGAETRLLTADQIVAAYPFYNVDDILLGSINTRDEGLWDGTLVFDWWRKSARERGVEYLANEVVAITRNPSGTAVDSVTLSTGQVVRCDALVNATGPRAARTAQMAGLALPVEPRKRFSWVFSAQSPLDRDLPLTIDPSGVHVRENGGGTYLAGGHPAHDPAVAFDDFTMDHSFWQDQVWPILATRIPQFEAIKVTSEWAGHYAYNTLDQNAVIGPHPDLGNFYFLNGFSGHGLQQSPAMGRGMAELLVHGGYRTLDLTPFGYQRIVTNSPMLENAVI